MWHDNLPNAIIPNAILPNAIIPNALDIFIEKNTVINSDIKKLQLYSSSD